MSIGNCPRCGGECDDDNEYCLYCWLAEISLSIDESSLSIYDYHCYDDLCETKGHAWGTDELNRVECGRCGQRKLAD